ncbi:MAG: hypothetical protein AB2660_05275 [Candidatus Thiodiazotropha sp.]
METRISDALDTALLNLEAHPQMMSIAASLTQGVLEELRDSGDWSLDINGWPEARDKLTGPLKEHLADHLNTLPEESLVYVWGEHLAKDIERDTWKGLSADDQEEVWTELADRLLLEVVH